MRSTTILTGAAGSCAFCAFPKRRLSRKARAIGAWALNTWSNLVGATPAFGAWCTEGDDFVFVQFLPNFVRRLPGLTDLLIEWSRAEMDETIQLVQYERNLRCTNTGELT